MGVTIQKYGQRQIAPTALPGVRLQSAETAGSEGAGVELAKAQTSKTAAGLAGQAADIGIGIYADEAKAERQRANQVAIYGAQNQIDEWRNKTLYGDGTDQNPGVLSLKGKNALGAPEDVRAQYDELVGQIETGLATPEQKAAFQNIKLKEGTELDLTVRRHVAEQINAYEGEEVNASIANATENAIHNALDPRIVGENLDRAVSVIKTSGPRLGLGPEAIAAQVKKTTSTIHEGVIDQLLANDQEHAAQVYFDETKGEIQGDKLANIEKALEEGGLRKTSQAEADSIIAAGGTLQEQLDKAKSLDPKVRDLVEQRIEHQDNVNEKAKRDTDEARLTQAYNIVDRTKNVTAIPPAQWSQLSGGARASLRAYAENLVQGVPTKTDPAKYYALMTEAGTDPVAFATRNLLESKGSLDDGDFHSLAGLQLSLRNRDTKKADEQLRSFRTREAVWHDIVTESGLDEKQPATSQLRRTLDEQVDAWQQKTGKDASNEEIQTIADRLVSRVIIERGFFFNTEKKATDLTLADIPQKDQNQAAAILRERGLPVTPDAIVDYYFRAKQAIGDTRKR